MAIRLAEYLHYAAYLGDFRIFWLAGRRPDFLYADLPSLPFAYPPTTLMFLGPFGALPLWWSFALWVVAGLAAGFLVFRRVVAMSALALSLLTFAVVSVLVEGQVGLFVAALAVGAILARDPRLVGLLFGVAAAIKPQSLVALPFALAGGRHWRAMGWTIAAALVLFGLTLVLFGWELWARWLAALPGFHALLVERGLDRKDAGLFGLATSLGLPGWTYALGWPLGIAVPYLAWRRLTDPADRYAALACGTVLLSPYTLGYDLAGLTIVATGLLLQDERSVIEWLAAALIVGQVLPAIGIVLLSLSLLVRARSRQGTLPIAARIAR